MRLRRQGRRVPCSLHVSSTTERNRPDSVIFSDRFCWAWEFMWAFMPHENKDERLNGTRKSYSRRYHFCKVNHHTFHRARGAVLRGSSILLCHAHHFVPLIHGASCGTFSSLSSLAFAHRFWTTQRLLAEPCDMTTTSLVTPRRAQPTSSRASRRSHWPARS